MTSELKRSARKLNNDLALDREALADTLAELRERLNPRGLMEDSTRLLRGRGAETALSSVSDAFDTIRSSKATPWIAGAAVAGVAVALLAKKASRVEEELPLWLEEIQLVEERADALMEQAWEACEEGILDEDEFEEARLDIQRALEADRRRAMMSGLEGLAADEREAALAVREARLNGKPKGTSTLTKAVLMASAAAGAAVLVNRLNDGKSDGLLADVKSGIDQAIKRLDQVASDFMPNR